METDAVKCERARRRWGVKMKVSVASGAGGGEGEGVLGDSRARALKSGRSCF